jgi:hypothetical protein
MLNGVDACAIEGDLIQMTERCKAERKEPERIAHVGLHHF